MRETFVQYYAQDAHRNKTIIKIGNL